MSGRRAVFLDRDGVITQEPPHYAHRVDQLKFIPGAPEAIRSLNQNGYLVIVVTNQSGIGRGYYLEEDTIKFNQAMEQKLDKYGARIDAIYYCPHHPDDHCECRKPKPGMLLDAGKRFNINFTQSFMVGDRMSDIEAGEHVGCETILVLDQPDMDHTKIDLTAAVQWIKSKA